MSATVNWDDALLERCLEQKERGWEDFVDRFAGLILQVIEQTAQTRRQTLRQEQKNQLCQTVFQALRHNHFEILRHFDRQASLSTYLTVATRRLVVPILLQLTSVDNSVQ